MPNLENNPYHIHLYFDEKNPSSTESAQEIQDKFVNTFSWAKAFLPVQKPVGPHPTGMWEAHFTNVPKGKVEEERKKVIEFFEKNRNGHQVLIHKNSGNDLTDHTEGAYWVSGDTKNLDLSAFKH